MSNSPEQSRIRQSEDSSSFFPTTDCRFNLRKRSQTDPRHANTSLVTLDLTGNEFGSEGVDLIEFNLYLAANTSLKRLILQHDELSHKAASIPCQRAS
jgi:hypothetical protein